MDQFAIRHKKLESQETLKLSEVLSVIEDLKISKEYCLLMKKYLSHSEDDETKLVLRSLWESTLISFFRCFKSGVRKFSLKKDIFNQIKGETMDFLIYLENTRDKHIAHSANTMSNVIIGICINQDNDVIDTSFMSTRHVGENEHNIDMFLILLNFSLEYCQTISQKCHLDVLNYAKKLEKSTIANLKDLEYQVPDILESAKKYRKQVQDDKK